MSQHVLPTWQTGLSSRVPTPSLPAVEVHGRLSVRPSVHVCCGCSSLPHSCWAWPQAVPRPRECEQTWPSSGSHCARLPFCHHSTSASRNGTRAETSPPGSGAQARAGTGRRVAPSRSPLSPAAAGSAAHSRNLPTPRNPVWGRGALQSTGGGAYPTVAHQGRHCGWLR